MGWVFRDRNLFRQQFGEAAPGVPEPPYELMQKLEALKARLPKRLLTSGGIGLGVAMVLGCCAAAGGDAGAFFGFLALLSFLGGGGAAAVVVAQYVGMKSRVAAAHEERRRWYDQAQADWAARKVAFERADWERIDQMLEWGAVPPGPGSRRVDIVGGNLWGWEALLTVFGTSLLSTRGGMVLVDLSGEAVSRELLRLADANNVSIDLLLMPDELHDSDLLVGLSSRELVDTLVESIYSGEDSPNRAGRSMDDRILTGVCSILGEDVSMARVGAALRVLMNEPGDTSALTPEERRTIADDLFGDEYRRQAHQHLSRLESFVHPLAGLGTRRQPRPEAALTCLALATDGRNVRNELLNDLIVQWLIRRIAQQATELGSLVIAGADDIPARHIERLSDLCERRGVRLVLLYRHLRGHAVQAIGGGTVGFMRLGNHEEARQAAEFIGHNHKFVLSQVTRSLGGNETHTVGDTEGGSETEGHSTTNTTTTGTSSGGGSSSSFGGGGGTSSNWGRSKSWSRSETKSWSVSRNWSQTRSVAEGTNWNNAAAAQRVYEYTVEPRALQDLPDYAMVVVRRDDDGAAVIPVECNPDIVTMPRLSMAPLPQVPQPRPAQPALPGPAPQAVLVPPTAHSAMPAPYGPPVQHPYPQQPPAPGGQPGGGYRPGRP
ncbi:hypothetical protein [Plantactinospora soyae]|uniref:Membrane protein YgcG n=1 Tax=Plantactinospora soyae TaxID=1544732 RepID=A0A927MBM7_9ACTN|nr:hypothetical protein [Plantactinospora soyae]MBE1490625.1 putative membrane protein YgcG [Plantactinospora soyae]